jgi:hypothetical protein
MRPLRFILNIIIVLFAVTTASCKENAIPSAPTKQTAAPVTATMTRPSSVSAIPTRAVGASPTIQTTSVLSADTATNVGPACTEIGQTWTSPVDGVVLGCVPAGEFLMGAAETDVQSPTHSPSGPEEGDFRVRRGGGTKSLASDLRVTSRASGRGHHYFDGQMGFRCAVSTGTP